MNDAPKASPSAPSRRRRGRLAAILTGGTVLLLGGAYGVGYALSGGTLAPRTTIEGVAVGGLTPAEAETRLTEGLASRVQAPMTLRSGEHGVTKTPAELGLAVDAAASVRRAGAEKSFNPVDIWASLTGGRAHEAVVTADAALLRSAAGELAQQTDADPTNAELAMEEGAFRLKPAVPGRAVDADATAQATQDAFLTSTEVDAVVGERPAEDTTEEAQQALDTVATPALSGPISIAAGDKTFEVTPAMIAGALTFEAGDGVLKPVLDGDKLMEQAASAMAGLGLKEPKDARFTFEGGKPTVVPSVDGVGVGKDDLVRAVGATMTKTSERAATVTVAPQQASFTTEMANASGVKEITGEFTTRFPATAYRVNNIGKSAGLVNGVFLKPGETFSMNKVLGPRTLARGWMAGGAIDGGRVVERMGGGISQTTTTTFNAIFFAGLEDVTHKPHSLYFSRYPMGREATLDYNSVEMKFKNNTQYGVLMQAFTNNPPVGGQGTVTVRVWSTKIYDVTASAPVQSNVRDPGPAIRNDSPVCSPQSAMRGFTVNYNRLFHQGGKLVRTEPFTWTYNTLTPVTCTHPNARPDRVER